MFLIDTDVLSALAKRRRNNNVEAWIAAQRTGDLFVSVISIGEIERGIAQQWRSNPEFASALALWLDRVLAAYGDRVLPFDLASARRWGQLSAAIGSDGADLQIAATALERGLTVVTRNVSDFEPAGVSVLNPFMPPPSRRTEFRWAAYSCAGQPPGLGGENAIAGRDAFIADGHLLPQTRRSTPAYSAPPPRR